MMRTRLLRQITVFGTSQGLASALRVLKLVADAALLGPVAFGIWTVLRTIRLYATYGHLGVLQGMQREVPFARGAGNRELASHLAAAAFSGTAVLAVVMLLSGLGVASVLPTSLRTTLTLFAILLGMQLLATYCDSYLKAHGRFEDAGVLQAGESVLQLCTIPLIVVAGLDGLILGQVAIVLVLIPAYLLLVGVRISWRFDLNAIALLLKTGIPIAILGAVATLFITIDRLIIASIGPIEAAGQYAFAALPAVTLISASEIVAAVIYPRLCEYAGAGDRARADVLVAGSVRMLGAVVAFGGTLIWLLIPPITRAFVPSYANAIDASRLLVVATVFYAVAAVFGVQLLALSHAKVYLVILGAAALAQATLVAVMYGSGGIIAAASATVIVFFLYCLTLSIAGGEGRRDRLRVLLAGLIPAFPLAIATFIAAFTAVDTLEAAIATVLVVGLVPLGGWLVVSARRLTDAGLPTLPLPTSMP